MKVLIFKTAEQSLLAIAELFVQAASKAVEDHSEFNVALSGGSSPKKLYELLASPSFNQRVDWRWVYFFFGDERYVPFNDPDNNALMVRKALFDPLNIPDSQIFIINTALSPPMAAKSYMDVIESHFKTRRIKFDLILLGLGDNSHTASLFPHTPVLHEKTSSVKEVFLNDQQVYRITFTAPLINKAHHTAFLVYGETKAIAVHNILEGEKNIEEYPAQLIDPEDGYLTWFLDESAASLLRNKY